MGTATITSKGQITLPKEIREGLGLKAGDKVVFTLNGSQAIVTPLKKRSILELRGCLPATRKTPDWQELRKITRQTMAKRIVEEM